MSSSPFLKIPAATHVAGNRSAFAVLDRYPVTKGHTLVVPRRLIATWWEASDDERRDLLALVDQVKAILDEQYRPDGYNVGFNEGAAAGQTVGHLHLHVIPRRHGDMVDPRGGIRHVIPSRGNYLRETVDPLDGRPPTLVDGLERALLPVLRAAINDPQHDRIAVVVSFVKRSGVELVLPELRDAVERGTELRLLTTDYLGITEPGALAQLLDLELDQPDLVRVAVHRAGARSFHPKAYLFWSSTDAAVALSYVGSSNLTRSGLSGGIEWNVGFGAVDATLRSFERLWDDARTERLSRELVAELAASPRLAAVAWTPRSGRRDAADDGPFDAEDAELAHDEADDSAPIVAHPIQAEAMRALVETRDAGNTAGLVVLATGLGKTYLAALDCRETGARKVLFVAHRDEILTQARDAFRAVHPDASLGLFTGSEREPDADIVFASVRSLVTNLDRFAPDQFDYVVVDEFHHAAADGYRRVLDHLRPGFLLGLTATPERMDGASILSLCHDNLVYSCDLVEGIRRERLVPFRYHGVLDTTDYTGLPWRSGRFSEAELEVAVSTQERAQLVLEKWRERAPAAVRTLAFCVTQAHADQMARYFMEHQIRAAAVHSGPASAPRAESLRAFEEGTLDVLFSVDMFNEGVDVPSIDTVLLLRPTASPIVFLQQLGRGLRLHPGKDEVVVLDLVGNHRSFLLRPRTLLTLALGRTPTDREVLAAMSSGTFELPVGCSVDFQLELVDLLGALVAQRSSGSDRLLEYLRSHLAEEGRRATKVQALRAGLNPAKSATKKPWFELLTENDLLDDSEDVESVRSLLPLVSRVEDVLTTATKSYKVVTLRALVAMGALRSPVPIDALVQRARATVLADPRLVADVRGAAAVASPSEAAPGAWRSLWRKNPLDALTTPHRGQSPLFRVTSDDQLVPTYDVAEAHGPLFDRLVAELVEYRLARYLIDRPTLGAAPGHVLKVSQTNGRPIVFLDRAKDPELPEGTGVPLRIDGDPFEGDFRKIALNVVRRDGEATNALPDVLRSWFGPDAGQPGTHHRIVAEDRGDYWTMAPHPGHE